MPGLHHVTAITSDAQKNVDFYAGLLGLRLVKVTVNFDDPVEPPPLLRRRTRPARIDDDVLRLARRDPRPSRPAAGDDDFV